MLLANLQIDIGITGVGSVVGGLTQINAAVNNTASAAGGRGASNIMSFVRSFDELSYVARTLGDVSSAVTGIGIAASYTDIQIALEAVVGNADSARAALEQFTQIGLRTSYDTLQVAQLGMALINTGTSAEKAGAQVSQMLDIAAASGMQRDVLPRFIRNMQQLRAGQLTQVNIREMVGQAPGLSRMLGQQMGLGRPATLQEITADARKRGGTGFFDMLLGMSSNPGVAGAAERIGMRSPTAFLGNLFESLDLIMKPTGDIILALVMPLGLLVYNISSFLGAVNRLGHGIPGVLVLVYALWRGWFIVQGAIGFVRKEIDMLVVALRDLATSARGASGASGTAAGARGVGLGIGRSEIIGLGVGMGLTALGAWLQGNENRVPGSRTSYGEWGNILTNAGAGATLGGILGSVFPGIGNALGAVIGGSAGALGTMGVQAWQQTHASKVNAPIDANTAAINENTEAVKANNKASGGGERARRITSQLEWEYALAAAMGI